MIGAMRTTATQRTGADPHWEIRTTGYGLSEIHLAGRLRPEWAAHLTARVAHYGMSIQRGQAARDAFGLWTASFDITGGVPDGHVLGLSHLDWSGPEVRPPRTVPRLEKHSFSHSDEHDGSIRLDIVEAPDCVGFLAALLWRLEAHGLFPIALDLSTREGRVFDSLWLREMEDPDERVPRVEICTAIRRHLDQFTGIQKSKERAPRFV